MINRFIILKKIVKNLVWQYFFPIYFSITRGWRALHTPNLYYVIYGQPLTSLGIILLKRLFWLLSLVVQFATLEHTSYLSREPQEFSCKFFLAGVNFYRFNGKNWQFTVYIAVITLKIGIFLCIFS